jgi:hypothetical protein
MRMTLYHLSQKRKIWIGVEFQKIGISKRKKGGGHVQSEVCLALPPDPLSSITGNVSAAAEAGEKNLGYPQPIRNR